MPPLMGLGCFLISDFYKDFAPDGAPQKQTARPLAGAGVMRSSIPHLHVHMMVIGRHQSLNWLFPPWARTCTA